MSTAVLECKKCHMQNWTVKLDLLNKEASVYCNKCGENYEINELLGKRQRKPGKNKKTEKTNKDTVMEEKRDNSNQGGNIQNQP